MDLDRDKAPENKIKFSEALQTTNHYLIKSHLLTCMFLIIFFNFSHMHKFCFLYIEKYNTFSFFSKFEQ